jgi:hypothetical protein
MAKKAKKSLPKRASKGAKKAKKSGALKRQFQSPNEATPTRPTSKT